VSDCLEYCFLTCLLSHTQVCRPEGTRKMRFIMSDGFKWRFGVYDRVERRYFVSATRDARLTNPEKDILDRQTMYGVFWMINQWVSAVVLISTSHQSSFSSLFDRSPRPTRPTPRTSTIATPVLRCGRRLCHEMLYTSLHQHSIPLYINIYS
jgi:hypothetical protein